MKNVLTIFILSASVLAILLGIANIYYEKTNPSAPDIQFGITFSSIYAKYLLGDWQKTYLQILDDLKVKHLRIPAYWEQIEPQAGKWDFSSTDFIVSEAEKRDAKILMAMGMKLPRWPECHIPNWAQDLNQTDRQQQTLIYIQQIINRYKNNPAISGWQIENEPLFSFGTNICAVSDTTFLASEVNLARKLDPTHPIILTDSGELRMWIEPMQLSDIFGTTLYRTVYNPIFGYLSYPLPPSFYHFKSQLVHNLFAPKNQKTIVIELQTEPWLPQGVSSKSVDQQFNLFTPNNFQDNISFAKRTGFDEIYLWGAEWWYYMAKNGHPEYLEYAKSLFSNPGS